MRTTHLSLIAALVVTSGAALAQSASTPTTTPAATPAATTSTVTGKSINQREENQQDRIAAGIKDDKLTDTQAAHLETQEAGIVKEESGMRAQDNGKLTEADKKLLNKQLNEESRRIRRDERHTTHPHK